MCLLKNQCSQCRWQEDVVRPGRGCRVRQEKHFVLQQRVVGAAALFPYSCSNHEIGSAAAPGTLNSVSAGLWFTRGRGGTAVQLLGAKFVRSRKEMCWNTHQMEHLAAQPPPLRYELCLPATGAHPGTAAVASNLNLSDKGKAQDLAQEGQGAVFQPRRKAAPVSPGRAHFSRQW